MGRRLDNWLSKASTPKTRTLWSSRWKKFSNWVVSENNPLTGKPYMDCSVDEVDDVIRRDFETIPSHLFQDKYKDVLTDWQRGNSSSRRTIPPTRYHRRI